MDYTIEGDQLTFATAFLASLPDGDSALELRFRGDFRDDVHSTAENGAAVSLAFSGTKVTLTGATGPDQGTAEIYLDGKLVDTIDLHSDTRLTQQELFTRDGLKKGDHTIKIVKTSGDLLRIDALSYVTR